MAAPFPHPPDDARRARRVRIAALAALLLAVALACAWCALHDRPDEDMESNIVVGALFGEEDSEKDRRALDEGMIGFSVNTRMAFETPSSEGAVMFENPAGNAKYTRLRLVRDDTGEEVYATGLLQPGTYVEKDALDAMVPTGEYDCTALVEAYRTDDKSYIGTVAAGVKVKVGG
ncbi:hypothetical protein [Enteroscipio rubneri]|uniref:Uncharacterized protein n=1 Tax=Enteroscipio rubneri TaxID=2070686 RepID=A0A2K2U952_9ACTN|nr:hypothetical protein [Enteroscipio rubneri]PNV66861.1 hypothetical protein C2L71_11080 [Enteroscipio rubneri]